MSLKCECKSDIVPSIPITGKLIPASMDGFVIESKYVKGGYVVVQTIEERDQLLDKTIYETNSTIVNGSLVYVADEKKSYRYNDQTSSWDPEEISSDIEDQLQEINQQLQTKADIKTVQELEAKLEEKADSSAIPDVSSFITKDVNNLTNYDTTEQVNAKLDGKQDKLISGENIATINGKSLLEGGDITIDSIFDTYEPVTTGVGGIPQGTVLGGMTYGQIFRMMFYGASNPEFTDPSMDVVIETPYGVAGSSLASNCVITFNRGAISPAYGTDGYRAGQAISYQYGSDLVEDSSDEVTVQLQIPVLLPGDNQVTFKVKYGEGPQPLNSVGIPYSTPLAAGELEQVVTVKGLTTSLTGSTDTGYSEDVEFSPEIITDVTSIDKVGVFKDLDGTGYQIIAPAATNFGEAQVILIPSSVELVGIKGWNPFAEDEDKWTWLGGSQEASLNSEYIKSDETVIETIDGVNIEYCKYVRDVETYGEVGTEVPYRFYTIIRGAD